MTTAVPTTPADPEIAAAVFDAHLTAAMSSPQARRNGWIATRPSPLIAVINITATDTTGQRHPYYLRLDATFYDQSPPRAVFVVPPQAENQGHESDWIEAVRAAAGCQRSTPACWGRRTRSTISTPSQVKVTGSVSWCAVR